ILLILPVVSSGQSAYFTINNSRFYPFKADTEFSLNIPILSSQTPDSTSANRINSFLQLFLLKTLPQSGKSVFSNWIKSDIVGFEGVTYLRYDIHANTDQILSVVFDKQWQWATTEYIRHWFNFNAQNGDRIELPDLFSDSGWQEFKKLLDKKRRKQFQREFAHVKDSDLINFRKDYEKRYLKDDFRAFYIDHDTI